MAQPQPPAPSPSPQPQIRRPPGPARGEPEEAYRRETVASEAQEAVLGDWGLGVPPVPIAQLGRSIRCIITRFPARQPSKASRLWKSGTCAKSASRYLAPEHLSEHQNQVLRASRSRFRRPSWLCRASQEAYALRFSSPRSALCAPRRGDFTLRVARPLSSPLS